MRSTTRSWTHRSERKGLPGGTVDIGERYTCDSIARVVRRLDSACASPATRDASGRRYVVLGLDVALHYLPLVVECLSLADDPERARARTELVFLQSVVDNVASEGTQRERAALDALMRDQTLCTTFFADTFHAPAQAMVAASEASVPRTSCAIGCGAACFTQHVLPSGCDALFATDDAIAAAVAEMSGAAALGLDAFVALWGAAPGSAAEAALQRLLAALRRAAEPNAVAEGAEGSDGADAAPAPHWAVDVAERAIARGELLRGVLRARGRDARRSAVAACGGQHGAAAQEVVLEGFGAVNRATHGDSVAVRVVAPAAANGAAARGRVVAVLRRAWRPLVATVSAASGEGEGAAAVKDSGREVALLAIPMDPRLPKLRLRTRQHARLAGHRLVVEIDRWVLGSQYPEGHYVRDLGAAGEVEVEVEALMVHSEMAPHMRAYPEAAMAALPPASWRVGAEELRARRDLRRSTVFSIDPPGCEDIDDAMSVTCIAPPDAAGIATYEVGVHIADVTHFVAPGSPLDVEAQLRSTTVYLVDRRYNMLPARLSSNLCSLRANIDRCAMSTVWRVRMRPAEEGGRTGDGTFEVLEAQSWIGKSAICSSAALTYAQAQDLVDGRSARATPTLGPESGARARRGAGPDYGDGSRGTGAVVSDALAATLRPKIALLRRVARERRAVRAANGALELGGAEVEFTLDSAQRPVEVAQHGEMEIHHVVAELMIMANAAVADRLLALDPACALVRRHMPSAPAKFGALRAAFAAIGPSGVALDVSSSLALRTSLIVAERRLKEEEAQARGKKRGGDAGEASASLLRTLATRAMSEAEYVCSGAVERDASGGGTGGAGSLLAHYGLAIPRYTHFTSPIRRYADVVVHRLLERPARVRDGGGGGAESALTLAALPALPASLAPSFLRADDRDSGREGLSAPAARVADGGARASKSSERTTAAAADSAVPAAASAHALQRVCGHLNAMTRNAKVASRNGERLALALLFRDAPRRLAAVVKDVRCEADESGALQCSFEVWVPLLQRTARVHLDESRDGAPRRWHATPVLGARGVDDVVALRLEAAAAGAKGGRSCTLSALAHVTLDVSCDWGATVARCPSLSFKLVAVAGVAAAATAVSSSSSSLHAEPDGALRLCLAAPPSKHADSGSGGGQRAAAPAPPAMGTEGASMYRVLLAHAERPAAAVAAAAALAAPPVKRRGASRFAFSNFVNEEALARLDPSGLDAAGHSATGVSLRPPPAAAGSASALLVGLDVRDHARDVQMFGGDRRGRLQSAKRSARVKRRGAK